MPRRKLTRKVIAGLKPDPTRDALFWDTLLAGFGLRLTRRGAAAYVAQYRALDGRSRRVTIGGADVLTLEQARARAKVLFGQVAEGRDPAAERETARRAAKESKRVAEVLPLYLDWLKVHARPRTVYEWSRLWRVELLPEIGAIRVADVTRSDLGKLHVAHASTPTLANRIIGAARSFFSWAEASGFRKEGSPNPGRRSKHGKHGIKPFPEPERKRFLNSMELQRLGAALQRAETVGLPPAESLKKEPKNPEKANRRPKSADVPFPASPFAIGAIRLLALSGMRVQEALSLRWDAIDFERGIVTLEQTKTGQSQRSLGAPAFALLDSLPRISGSPFVFPGVGGKPLATIQRIWRSVREAAQLSDLHLHDLRHGFASTAASGGASLYETGLLLGHLDAASTARYAHVADDGRRRLADRVAGDIAAALDRRDSPVLALAK